MPRGYRLFVLAAFGWLALGAASPSGNSSQPKEDRTEQEISDSLGRVANALDQANEPKRETTDCPKGADDRKSDLCAQWYAADAAKQAADAADTTVTINWIGLALAAVTMGAAIAAAVFAKKAADHTKEGNEIAARQEKVANEASLRRKLIFRVGADWAQFEFELVNEGRTSARNIQMTCELRIHQHSFGPIEAEMDWRDLSPHEVGRAKFKVEPEAVVGFMFPNGGDHPIWQSVSTTFGGVLSFDTEFGERISIEFFKEHGVRANPAPAGEPVVYLDPDGIEHAASRADRRFRNPIEPP